MKKYYTLLLFFMCAFLEAQTIVPGGTIAGEEWTSNESPYLVSGNVIITSLTINHGVRVEFADNYSFRIDGTITITGTISDSVIFTTAETNNAGWSGIHVNTTATSALFSFCRIEEANAQSMLVEADNVLISNCDLIESGGNGLRVNLSEVTVLNSRIFDHPGHGISLYRSQINLYNTLVSNNNLMGINSLQATDAIFLQNSIIANNDSTGILCDKGKLEIINSIVYGNQTSLESPSQRTTVTYSNIQYSLYPGEGNIQSNPYMNEGFSLQAMSPCINRGSPLLEYSDVYFPPSRGTTRNDMGIFGGPLAGSWLDIPVAVQTYLDFGSVGIGFSKKKNVVLLNPTGSSVSISQVNITGADTAEFEILPHDMEIGANDSLLIEIQFTPGSVKTFNAEIAVSYDTGEIRNRITGQGLAPAISASETNHDFGPLLAGLDSTIEISIYNNGQSDLILYAGSSALSDSNNFSTNLQDDSIVPVSGFANISFTFNPQETGSLESSFNLKNNDPLIPELEILLNGTGIYNEQYVPKLSVSEGLLNFGEVSVDQDSTLKLTVLNLGPANLILYADSLKLTNGTHFLLDEILTDISIPGSGSTELNITFSPADSGFIEDSLIIVSNDPTSPDTVIVLNGIGILESGISPRISVPENPLNFGSVYLGQDTTLALTVFNTGPISLTIKADSLKLVNGTHYLLQEVPSDIVIPSEDSVYINITFSPADSGVIMDTLHIISDDLINPSLDIILTGRSLLIEENLPLIEVSKAFIDFGNVFLEQDSVIHIKISNLGNADLVIYSDSLNITGSEMSSFSYDPVQTDVLILPDSSYTFKIHFIPISNGSHQAHLNIFSNDKRYHPKQIQLSGTGKTKVISSFDYNPTVSNAQFTFGKPAVIAFDIQSNTAIDSCSIFTKIGGASSYTRLPMINQNGNTWQVQLNDDMLTQRGLNYYLVSYQQGTEIFYPESGAANPVSLEVKIPFLNFPFPTKENIYQLISLPVVTDHQNISDILKDDLGDYDNTKYRLFDYKTGVGYEEIINLDKPLPPGKSVWLITKTAKNLDVENSSSVPSALDYQINLNTGWNMIANPFSFPVQWSDVDNNLVLRFYNGNDWLINSVIEPFMGYLVWADTDTAIMIPPHEYSGLGKRSIFTIDSEWHIQVKAESDVFSDQYNFAGVKKNSSNNVEKNDYREPPPIGKFLTVYFEIDGSKNRFSTDFRQPGEKGYRYTLNVNKNFTGNSIVSFSPENLPSHFDWAVVSDDLSINYGKERIKITKNSKRFVLLVGDAAFLTNETRYIKNIPLDIRLSQNYPNPFNPNTKIDFQLNEPQLLKAEIYNILGQKVITLINNKVFNEGYYKIEWNGFNGKNEKISSGIYFLRFRAGSFVKTIKMILKN